jgi:hypothetical protein
MSALLLKFGLGPALMIVATLAARRWGPRLAGAVAAFPAIVGPLLLVTTLEHGSHAAARAAAGIVLGLVGLAAFAASYGRCARRHAWPTSLACGWLAAALAVGAASLLVPPATPLLGAVISTAALVGAGLALGRGGEPPAPMPAGARPGLAPRAAITALLVILLTAGVGRFGATAGGVLAALPVLASLLAVFTHREGGGAAAGEILRGTVAGMGGFLAFCEIVTLTIVDHGRVVAFVLATAAAILLQAPLARGLRRYPSARNSGGRSGEASASACLSPSASRSAA